jgi:hypothetical protein
MKPTGQMLVNHKNESRRELDFYPTPVECTIALCEFLKNLYPTLYFQNVIEPACGKGHMSEVMKYYFKSVESYDIRDTGYGKVGDYLRMPFTKTDALITNPPFDDSERFIEKALSEKHEIIAMLLKSQYWHSNRRRILFESCRPSYVLPLTWRPDFMAGEGTGGTMEVLWTVWTFPREEEETCSYIPLKKPFILRARKYEFAKEIEK